MNTLQHFIITMVLITISLGSYANSANSQTIHVLVALCDNENQGIAPVPERLGNGKDPHQNLYWGALYGIKTTFIRNNDWKLIEKKSDPEECILERCVFKHRSKNIYMVAEAYDGAFINQTIQDYMDACSGRVSKDIWVKDQRLSIGGEADLLVYIGHNGLIEQPLSYTPTQANQQKRESITLCCYSKDYFSDHIKAAGAYPLLWTTHLIAPEGYILENALKGWVNRESHQQIRQRAASAYNKYQKCGYNAASRLIVSGW